MKGIVEVEFIISVFVFITTISFVAAMIVGNIPLFHDSAVAEGIKSKSHQYSELLLFDEGYPRDWNGEIIDDIYRFGFSTGKRYFIDINKLDKMNQICNSPGGYNATKNRLGMNYRNEIKIEATYMDNSPVIGTSSVICEHPGGSNIRHQFHTVRLAVLNSTITPMIRLKVTVM